MSYGSSQANKAVIKNADMSEDMQQGAVDCAQEAMQKYNLEKDIAAHSKKEFDKRYNPTWHCIVGRNFGRYDITLVLFVLLFVSVLILCLFWHFLAMLLMRRNILFISTWVRWLFCSLNQGKQFSLMKPIKVFRK